MIIVGTNDGKKEELPKSISEAISKSRPEVEPPQGQGGPVNPFKPDPFREPINKLDQTWHLESPELQTSRPVKPNLVPPVLPGELPVIAVEPSKPVFTTPPVAKPISISPGPFVDEIPRPAVIPAPTQMQKPPATPVSVPASSAPAPAEPPKQKIPSVLKNIRTYESDIADHLANRKTSRASMAIAENVKRGEGAVLGSSEKETKSRFGWKVLLVLLALVLMGGGAFAGYYLYMQSPLGTKPPGPATTQKKSAPGLIPYESQLVISTDGVSRTDIINRVKAGLSKAQEPNTIREVVFTQTKESATYRVSAPEMINIMSIAIPDIVFRTIKPEWMFGIYANKNGENSTFAILGTNLFQNAFAGMLSWESGMMSSLADLISTATTTSGFARTPAGGFRDQIVRNKDVRAFVTDNGSTALVYSFIDNATLIVAKDVETLGAIITRLENRAFVR